MTPLQFEKNHSATWAELETMLDRLDGLQKVKKPKRGEPPLPPVDGARMTALYRRSCEHLALAQARAYPIHLTHRLETLTQRGHRLVYRQHDYGVARLKQLVLIDFPQSVRGHRWYLLAATLLFVVPMLAIGWATYRDPGFVLHLMNADEVQNFDSMYGDSSRSIGHQRHASTDWQMFGYYIQHNIGIGFQCFASGLFWGLGSVFYLVFNGQSIGAVAGYLTARGYTETFYSFVVTHSAFELTAIVLSGAAGLRLGHALLSPGRRTRLESLKHAANDAITVVYGVMGMLLIAAAVEAFWSSARWVAPSVKYGVGAACWAVVIAYLGWQGRPARSPHAG
ncbi:stage II sporulation protein M [Aquabacterium sp.]|uniref:stage II sporulation protein M n=1 Tax=Aquabacterium sp. TaxID=1872578 RepID=UPI0024884DF0|nr:stage II sporulation protein M [Aquabacterium sp.]MDI1258894.1 stage II sporulation protein M [Aquabacterium sp.]